MPNISCVCQTFLAELRGMTKDWPRLARAVARRRDEIGLSRDAVHQAGGPSDVVIARIESNEEPRPRADTINKLDGPLRWVPGSAQNVLAGGDPSAVERESNLKQVSIDALLDEIRRRVDETQSGARRLRVDSPVAEDESELSGPFAAFFEEGTRDGATETPGEDRRENSQ